jgi:hypothetical protein
MVVVGHQRPYGRVSTLPFSFLMENIMRVDFANERFISLEDAGLEESSDLPVFGLTRSRVSQDMAFIRIWIGSMTLMTQRFQFFRGYTW